MGRVENKGEYPWVGEEYRSTVSTQSYGEKPQIEGVRALALRDFHDEGGDFCEIVRFEADGSLQGAPGYRPAQISYSLMEPGTIKAWHLHQNQDDLWFLPADARLLVGLLDTRAESPTKRTSMRLTFGAGTAHLLLIPRGVAHGVANLGQSAARLMYFVNCPFDPEKPDEHRLPHDLLGPDFWTIRPG